MSVLRSGSFGGAEDTPSKPAGAPAPQGAEALIAASRKARAEKTWIVTDGDVGMEAQGIAVAEAVGLPFSLKRVRITGAMRLLPSRLQIYVPPMRLLRSVSSNEPLAPPWPRLVISIGRRSVPIALAIKRVASAFGLHIQNPRVPPQLFDLVAAPVHDNFEGPNVITTFGAVHSVTEAAGTGKPVYVQRLKGNSRRLARFHTLMQERGATRPFQGKLEAWTYAPINDTEVVASAIRRALGLEKGRS